MQNHINSMTQDDTASLDASELLYKKKILLWIIFIASVSFLTSLNFPYQGEEAVYTLTAFEMWFNQEWFVPLFYGADYGRPPLFHWGIMLLSWVLGWEKMLLAARIVTLTATFASTLLLFVLTRHLFKRKLLSLLAVAIYLSGDLLYRRGWLAYADPIFAFFVFLAMASLFLALEQQKKRWFLGVILGLFAAYLSKALTGYVFYAGTFLVLAWLHPHRKFLLSFSSILTHLLVLFCFFEWDSFFGERAHNFNMLTDILSKFSFKDIYDYAIKLFLFPLETFYRWMPVIFVLSVFWIKSYLTAKKNDPTVSLGRFASNFMQKLNKDHHQQTIKIIFWIVLINYLPYWVAPFSRVRYLLPLYPWIALLLAYSIERLSLEKMKILFYSLILGVFIKYAIVFGYVPYYQTQYRGNYLAAAQDILSIVGDFPLYSNDVSATGVSITAHLDVLRLPRAPITYPPQCYAWKEGFVLERDKSLTHIPDAKIAKSYTFGNSKLYLFCRGRACESH